MDTNRNFKQGDMVRHFKRETVDQTTRKYLYRIIGEATDSESREKVMVYQALYDDCGIYVRPYDMFMEQLRHFEVQRCHYLIDSLCQ